MYLIYKDNKLILKDNIESFMEPLTPYLKRKIKTFINDIRKKGLSVVGIDDILDRKSKTMRCKNGNNIYIVKYNDSNHYNIYINFYNIKALSVKLYIESLGIKLHEAHSCEYITESLEG